MILYFYHDEVHNIIKILKVRTRKKGKKENNENLKRKKRKTICFNSLEIEALNKYYKKYRIDNQSKFMREVIMKTVLKKFSDDYPTLWEQPGISMQTTLMI